MILLLLLALPAGASAQLYDIPGAFGAVSIVASPAQPAPNSTVRLTLQSPLYDLKNSLISWRVNGEPLTEGQGIVSVSVNVGDAGETTEVTAALISGDNDALAVAVLTPASIDLLWEAEGFVPPMYRGRTLPGVGARVTFAAYPTFVHDGVRVDPKDLTYTWRNGDTVLGSLSGRGRSTISIDAPTLFGAETVSVEATTQDGTIAARASARIESPNTTLRLYENHPLFGPLYHAPFGASGFTPETEVTFLAVPYFAPARSADDPVLAYEWRVNRQSIAADKKTPSQITINAAGSSGIALIELAVGHLTNFFFGSEAAWQITFSSAAGGSAGGTNPFAPQQ